VTRCDCSHCQGLFCTIEPCLNMAYSHLRMRALGVVVLRKWEFCSHYSQGSRIHWWKGNILCSFFLDVPTSSSLFAWWSLSLLHSQAMLDPLMLQVGSAAYRYQSDMPKTSIQIVWTLVRFPFPGRDRPTLFSLAIPSLAQFYAARYRTVTTEALFGSTIPVRAIYQSTVSQ